METKNSSNNSLEDLNLYLNEEQQFEIIREHFRQYVNTLGYMPHKRVVLALYCIMLVVGTVLNVLILVTISRVRSPKSTSNRRMLMMHVVCDLALLWFGVPYTVYTVVHKSWQLGSVLCHLASFLIYFIVALTNFLVVSICLNRSVAIWRVGHRTGETDYDVNCRVSFLLFVAVILALLIALPSAIVSQVSQAVFPDPRFQKFAPCVCSESWSRKAKMAYDLILIISIYLIPLFVICLSQHIVTQQLRRSHHLLRLMGHSMPAEWRRRRQRLIRLCVLMTTLFVLSWFPNHLCNILTKILDVSGEVAEILQDYSMCLAMSNTVTGPLLLIVSCSAYLRYIRRLLPNLKFMKVLPDTCEPSDGRLSSSLGHVSQTPVR